MYETPRSILSSKASLQVLSLLVGMLKHIQTKESYKNVLLKMAKRNITNFYA